MMNEEQKPTSPGSHFRLCQLTPEQIPEAMALQALVLQELPDPGWFMVFTLEEMQDYCQHGEAFGHVARGRLMSVATLNPGHTKPAGCYAALLGRPVEHSLDVRNVIVHPKARRQGLHSDLLRLFDEIARATGANTLYATIAPENQPSIHSFAKAGYRYCATLPMPHGRERAFYEKGIQKDKE